MRSRAIDIVDETFVRASPARVRAALDAAGVPGETWPRGVRVEVTEDRGAKGVRWRAEGAISGRMEIWLEPYAQGSSAGGTIVHHFVQGVAVGGRARFSSPQRLARGHTRAWKRIVHAVKDLLEPR